MRQSLTDVAKWQLYSERHLTNCNENESGRKYIKRAGTYTMRNYGDVKVLHLKEALRRFIN